MRPVTLAPIETLSSVRSPNGVWHARYPSADRTLCGVEVGQPTRGRKAPPTCGPCSRIARRFDRIDGSMPDFWKHAA